MPPDNKQSPITNTQPVIPTMDDTTTPPMINSQQPTVNSEQPTPITSHQSPATDSGSAAPSEDIVMPPIITTSSPKKKFAGGKIIATILGLFLLVGGVGAGIILVGQNQNVNEKASEGDSCDSTDPVACGIGTDLGCSCPDWLPPNERLSQCKCAIVPDNQVHCGNTICPVGYGCNRNKTPGDGRDDFCEQGGSGGGKGGCWEGKVDCPPGTVINLGQPVNVFCSRNEASAAKPICSTGTAQKQTDVCCGGEDKDGEGTCGNPQFITYNCCPVDSPPVCTDTTSTYTKTVLHPTNPTGACWEFDQFGQFRRDTYKSHVNTNCGRRPGRDEETGEPNYACDYIVTCERKVTTCVCGTNTPPPTTAPTAQCQNVKAYSSTWALLTNAQLAALAPNTSINFCVTGIANGTPSSGVGPLDVPGFDRARFTINGVLQNETTTRPNEFGFCQAYVIPAGVTTFNVTAQIHHTTLGWK